MYQGFIVQSVSQSTLPVERTDELQYMAELRQELLTRFHESSFYMEAVGRNCDVRRYTDKYRALDKEKLIPGKSNHNYATEVIVG